MSECPSGQRACMRSRHLASTRRARASARAFLSKPGVNRPGGGGGGGGLYTGKTRLFRCAYYPLPLTSVLHQSVTSTDHHGQHHVPHPSSPLSPHRRVANLCNLRRFFQVPDRQRQGDRRRREPAARILPLPDGSPCSIADPAQLNKKVGQKLAEGIDKTESATRSVKETTGESTAVSKASHPRFWLTPATNIPAKDELKRAVDDTAAKADGASEASRQDVNHALGAAAGKAREAREEVNRKLKKSPGGP